MLELIQNRPKSLLLFLFHLAWKSRIRLPVLIAVGFMILDIRMHLEININLPGGGRRQEVIFGQVEEIELDESEEEDSTEEQGDSSDSEYSSSNHSNSESSESDEDPEKGEDETNTDLSAEDSSSSCKQLERVFMQR